MLTLNTYAALPRYLSAENLTALCRLSEKLGLYFSHCAMPFPTVAEQNKINEAENQFVGISETGVLDFYNDLSVLRLEQKGARCVAFSEFLELGKNNSWSPVGKDRTYVEIPSTGFTDSDWQLIFRLRKDMELDMPDALMEPHGAEALALVLGGYDALMVIWGGIYPVKAGLWKGRELQRVELKEFISCDTKIKACITTHVSSYADIIAEDLTPETIVQLKDLSAKAGIGFDWCEGVIPTEEEMCHIRVSNARALFIEPHTKKLHLGAEGFQAAFPEVAFFNKTIQELTEAWGEPVTGSIMNPGRLTMNKPKSLDMTPFVELSLENQTLLMLAFHRSDQELQVQKSADEWCTVQNLVLVPNHIYRIRNR